MKRVLTFVVVSVIGYLIGAWVVSRVPPLAALLQRPSA